MGQGQDRRHLSVGQHLRQDLRPDGRRPAVLVPVKLLQVEGATTEGVYRKPSMLFAISKNSKEPKAAAEIVNCLLNDPAAIKILGATRGVPSSKIALEELTKAGSIKPVQVEANKIVLESTGVGVSPLNEHPRVTDVFDSTFEAFAYGQASAEDAAAEIIDGINSALTGI
jgi:oligogalacturonide transport system substrate-binding protein